VSSNSENINELMNILRRGASDLIDDDELYDRQLFRDILNALSTVGKDQIFELKQEVYMLLDSWNENIRSAAIATLGFSTGLFLTEFEEKAYDIFINDSDIGVKRTALSAWAGYYFETADRDALITIYEILMDQNNDIRIRAQSYANLFSIAKGHCPEYFEHATSDGLLNSKTQEEFNSKVDWKSVENIMNNCASKSK
jgi:hypothetical protein